MDNSIGLHIYAISQHRKRGNKISFSDKGDGSRLLKTVPHFVMKYKSAEDKEAGNVRPWYLDPKKPNGDTFEGLIKYGSSGFATDIVDSKTRTIQYKRKITDIEVFDLYYRLWVPTAGEYALLALQTFGQRSCVGRFQEALEAGFRQTNDGFRIVFNPVAPSEIASYKVAEVKRLSLTKRDYSSDAADNQLGDPGGLVDLAVSFSAKPRSHLGLLKDFTDRFKGSVLEYNDTHFDEATAEIMVGGKRRKVTLVGISRNTGKFDLSEDVKRGKKGMPIFDSISSEAASIFASIAAGKE